MFLFLKLNKNKVYKKKNLFKKYTNKTEIRDKIILKVERRLYENS